MKRSNNEHSFATRPKKGFFIRDILEKPEKPMSLDDNKENIPPYYLSEDKLTRRQCKLRERQTQHSSNLQSVQNTCNMALNDNSYFKYSISHVHIAPDQPNMRFNAYKSEDFRQLPSISCPTDIAQSLTSITNILRSKEGLCDIYEAKQQKKWECNKCERNFDRPSLLDRHARTHTGERPFTCRICQKPFSSSSSLNTHSRIHTGEKPHICEICGKCFTASSNLYYHRMTHFEQKPHQCSFCEKSFPTPGDLRNHLPIHTSLWPLMCPCGRGFVKANPFRNHLLTHLGLPRYQCSLCSKSFGLLRLLKHHLSDEHKLSACECSSYWQEHLSNDSKSECHRLLELVKKSYHTKNEL